jgi:hypothetical protein
LISPRRSIIWGCIQVYAVLDCVGEDVIWGDVVLGCGLERKEVDRIVTCVRLNHGLDGKGDRVNDGFGTRRLGSRSRSVRV